MKDTQQKLFEVRTRIADIIDRLEAAETKDNIVRVEIPRIADLCRGVVPYCFKSIRL